MTIESRYISLKNYQLSGRDGDMLAAACSTGSGYLFLTKTRRFLVAFLFSKYTAKLGKGRGVFFQLASWSPKDFMSDMNSWFDHPTEDPIGRIHDFSSISKSLPTWQGLTKELI